MKRRNMQDQINTIYGINVIYRTGLINSRGWILFRTKAPEGFMPANEEECPIILNTAGFYVDSGCRVHITCRENRLAFDLSKLKKDY